MKTALGADVFLAQQQAHLRDALLEARPALVHRHAKAGELVRQERAREADLEAPARDRIEHADLARELERIVEHRQHRPGDEARLGAAHGCRSEEHDRVGAVAAVGVEIMLDRTHVRVTEVVAFVHQRERVLPVGLGRFLGRAHVGKELDSELHQALRHRNSTPTPRPKHPWKMTCMIIRLTSHPAATGAPFNGNTMNHSTSTGAMAPNRNAAT